MRGSWSWILLFLVSGSEALIPEPEIPQPDSDLCVQKPCEYSDVTFLSAQESAVALELKGVGFGDIFTFEVLNVTCTEASPTSPCPEHRSLLLAVMGYNATVTYLETGKLPEHRISLWQFPNEKESSVSVRIGRGHARIYFVLINDGQDVTVKWRVKYRIANCGAFLGTILTVYLIPLLILLSLYLYTRLRRKGEGGAQRQDAESHEQCCSLCDFLVIDENENCPFPISCEHCGSKAPQQQQQQQEEERDSRNNCCNRVSSRSLDWCWGFPASVFIKPKVRCLQYCMQNIQWTWVFNPDESSAHLTRCQRFLIAYACTFVNLMVLTVYSRKALPSTPKIDQADALSFATGLGLYYLGLALKALLSSLLPALMKLAAERERAPCLPREGEAWRAHCARWITVNGPSILALPVITTALAFTIRLFLEYRCAVLIRKVLLPFILFELAGSFLKFGFIPLNIWHGILVRFGIDGSDHLISDSSFVSDSPAAHTTTDGSAWVSGYVSLRDLELKQGR